MIVLRFLILTVFGLASLAAETIHLKTRDLQPAPDRSEYLTRPVQRRTLGTSHYLIQLQAPVSAEIVQKLRIRGIIVTGYLAQSTVMVAAPDDFSLDGLPVRWIGRLEHQDKVSPLVNAHAALAGAPGAYVVEFHSDVNMDEARAMVREHSLRLVENHYVAAHHLLVAGSFSALSRLAAWDEVAYIFPASSELLRGKRVYVCAGAIAHGAPVAQYVGAGYPWSVSGTGLMIRYFFSQMTEKLPASSSQSEILRAFTEWTKYANVSFSSAPSAQSPQTVNILFATGAHGDPYPFDNPSVLAHTFYPAPLNSEPIAGDMHLNNDERWQVGADTDLYSVALHEAGHALGLVHVDDPSDVMYPYYRMRTTLGAGDISVIQSYYGVASGSTPSQPAPPPAPLMLAVQSPAATSTTTTSAISVAGITSGGVAPVQIAWSTASGQIGNALGSANWSINSIPLSLGANNIIITAFDAAGHTAAQTISVTRQSQQTPPPTTPPPNPPSTPQPGSPSDKTPPSLRITNPASTIVSTTASSITFQGLASDNVGVTSVAWATSAGAVGNAVGTLTWTAQNIPLLVGSNTVTIRAYDAAGNSAWRAVTVVRH